MKTTKTEQTMDSPNLALNEISTEAYIYTRKIPTKKECEDLRAIKRIRYQQKIEDSMAPEILDFDYETRFKEEILDLGKVRKKKRTELIQKISEDFLDLLLKQGRKEFSRGFLNSYTSVIGTDMSKTRKYQEITKSILDYLLEIGKVKESENFETIHWFENKSLSSYDYGSYKILMKHKRKGCVSNGNHSLVLRSEPYVTVSYVVVE